MTTKEKIFETALELFANQGIKKTSTHQITAKIGIAEGTLFRHFKTKQILIDQIYLNIKKETFGQLSQIISDENSFEDNFKKISKYIVNYFIKNQSAFTFIEMADNYPAVSDQVKTEGQKHLDGIKNFIQKGVSNSIFEIEDEDFNMFILQSLFTAIIKYNLQKKRLEISPKQLDFVWKSVNSKD